MSPLRNRRRAQWREHQYNLSCVKLGTASFWKARVNGRKRLRKVGLRLHGKANRGQRQDRRELASTQTHQNSAHRICWHCLLPACGNVRAKMVDQAKKPVYRSCGVNAPSEVIHRGILWSVYPMVKATCRVLSAGLQSIARSPCGIGTLSENKNQHC